MPSPLLRVRPETAAWPAVRRRDRKVALRPPLGAQPVLQESAPFYGRGLLGGSDSYSDDVCCLKWSPRVTSGDSLLA